MASVRQIEANRSNAGKSPGPKTETGKAAACYNAVQHGFAGDHLVLSVEDRPAFEKLRAAEAAHLDSEMNCFPRGNDPEIGRGDAAKRLGHVYSFAVRELNPMLNFTRYEARFERSYYRALHELQRLLSQRSRPTPPPPTPTKINEKPKIGFVQQNPVGQTSACPSPATLHPIGDKGTMGRRRRNGVRKEH